MTTPPSWADRFFDTAQGCIVHAALEAILTVDEQQRIVMMNPAAQRMFGCTAEQAIGSQLSRFIPPAQRASHDKHVREFDASGAVELPMGSHGTIVGLRADGQEFPAQASISRMEIKHGTRTRRYFTALLRDLSGEQNMQAEVDALKGRVRAIFELAPVAIWITEGEQVVFANDACAALFGAPARDDLVGRWLDALLVPQSYRAVRDTVRKALASRGAIPLASERIARLDGAERDVVIAAAGLPAHGLGAVQMVLTDVTERAIESRELERSRRELRRLSASLVDAREEERRRIGRELHDELGQRLTALKMELSSLASLPQRRDREQRVASMLTMVDETVASVRRIATDLRPLMLDDLGLNAAIDWLVRDSARRMGIEIELRLAVVDPPIGDAATTALYRMVQEALTNITRHAHATRAGIEMRGERDDLLVTVYDNGAGFTQDSMHRERSHGLMGIRERAYMLGGSLEVGNRPEGGAFISLRLPLLTSIPGDESGTLATPAPHADALATRHH
jgi:PAS domain S-box-containing protein